MLQNYDCQISHHEKHFRRPEHMVGTWASVGHDCPNARVWWMTRFDGHILLSHSFWFPILEVGSINLVQGIVVSTRLFVLGYYRGPSIYIVKVRVAGNFEAIGNVSDSPCLQSILNARPVALDLRGASPASTIDHILGSKCRYTTHVWPKTRSATATQWNCVELLPP